MNRVCTYCNNTINDDFSYDEGGENLSICFDCLTSDLSPYGQSLERFLDTFSEPVFITGSNDDIWGANSAARQRVNGDIMNISEHPKIKIFGCLNEYSNTACLAEIKCLNCAIRFVVKKTFRDGDTCDRIPARHDLRSLEGNKSIEFFVSTKKVGTSVFLQIEHFLPVDLAV